MNSPSRRRAALSFRFCTVTLGLAAGVLLVLPGRAAMTKEQITEFRNTLSARVETTTILGGDYGVGGGGYTTTGSGGNDVDASISKFGGAGDIGAPRPLGTLGIGWQPRLQGSLGYLTARNHIHSEWLEGDKNENQTFAIQFGGGARFWLDEHFSFAPTFMGMYGHSENTYTAKSEFGMSHQAEARQLGLIDWTADTWTVRPSLNLQYQYTWNRILFTLSTEPTYFYTESFHTSSSTLQISGNSETWQNKLDVDVPLRMDLLGHELRSGGFFSRMDLYDGVRDGLNSDYVYEAHGRLVMDFLGQLWKVQWIGVGASRYWGQGLTGWSYGVDVAFRF